MKIQTKTALLFTMLTATILLFLSIAVYYFVGRFTSNDFLKRLELRTTLSAKIHFEQDETSADVFNQLRREYLEVLPHEREYILEYDPLQEKLITPIPADVNSRFIREIIQKGGQTAYSRHRKTDFAGVYYKDVTGDFIVVKSAVNEYGEDLIRNLRHVLAATFIGGLCVVFTVSLYFSRNTFRPVRHIVARARDISAHNLHLRINYSEGSDEISELAETFNNMLDRLETAFETQNNFISNASHELRTPLTAIIGEADIALSKPRSGEEYQQSLSAIIREAGKLHNLTSSLLSLAQSGFDGKKQEWSGVRIDEILFAVKETLDERDPNNQIIITMDDLPEDEDLLTVEGNENLLKLALSNVILNGCKYSHNQRVEVSLRFIDGAVAVTVVDHGIGIPQTELKHIYEPFFRASNSNPFEGYGVGLPLTKAIIKLHHGVIIVESEENKGTKVTLRLPSVAHLRAQSGREQVWIP